LPVGSGSLLPLVNFSSAVPSSTWVFSFFSLAPIFQTLSIDYWDYYLFVPPLFLTGRQLRVFLPVAVTAFSRLGRGSVLTRLPCEYVWVSGLQTSAVSKAICAWINDQSAILSWCQARVGPKTRFLDVGHPFWREDGSVVNSCCWPSPAQSFSGPSPAGLITIFYCLRL
jgi:hypothetical protein